MLKWSPTHRKGIFLLNSSSLSDVQSGDWFPYDRTNHIPWAPIVDGTHLGCIEKRTEFRPDCVFDGAIVWHLRTHATHGDICPGAKLGSFTACR